MTAPAAPASGRRASLGAAAVLVGFLLLAPPLYLLGPFALLMLLARPRTTRELFWLAVAAAGVSATLAGTVPLGAQVIRVGGIALAVSFALLSIRGSSPVVPRALAAVVLSTIAVGVWATIQGLSFADIQTAFTELLRGSYRSLVDLGGNDPKARHDLEEFIRPLLAAAPDIGRVMPGLLAIEALGGAVLAWSWHHRLSATPLGAPPGRFRDFRFNDHLVWGAIFTLGLMLVPLPEPAPVIAVNLLVVWIGLYVLRGLAVLSALLAPAPVLLKALAVVLGFLLILVVLGACLALGLADTWLNIRGRLSPPVPGGASQ
jgi:hypothetical protein